MTIDLNGLKWTKNIKPHHIPWAYPDIKTEDNFLLNWKTEQETNARKAKTNDLIILIQRARITHIVKVMDDILYQEKTDSDYINCRFVKAIWVTQQQDWINSPH